MSLFLARLAGSQPEMGAQHGRLVARDAMRLFASYRTMPERVLAGDLGRLGRLAVRAIASAWQARLAHDRPRELSARSRAFVDAVVAATGAPQPGALRAFAAMDALQNAVSLAAWLHQGPFAGAVSARGVAAAMPACSTAIAWGRATDDGELRFARNFDFPGVGTWDARPAFVICAPAGGQRYGFFAARGADTPAITVVNEAGLVMAPHTRWHRDVQFGGAMIVDLVHTIATRAESLDDAIAIARERPVSSSWGIAIGSARERTACVIELAGPHVGVVRPQADHLVCANRYRGAALREGELAASHAWVIQSERRERRLRQLIEDRAAPLTARELARFLGDRVELGDPRGVERQLGGVLGQALNVHCVVVAPALRQAYLGIDRAPVCEGTWAELGWDWDGPTGGWELDAHAASGFTARAVPDFTPSRPASRHVGELTRAYETEHDVPAALASVERAVRAAPSDPSLRLAALWLALEARDPGRAIDHARAGLTHEAEAYRRGQLLLWGARAAHREAPAVARAWRAELDALDGPGVDELKAQARRRYRGGVHANLLMLDAY